MQAVNRYEFLFLVLLWFSSFILTVMAIVGLVMREYSEATAAAVTSICLLLTGKFMVLTNIRLKL